MTSRCIDGYHVDVTPLLDMSINLEDDVLIKHPRAYLGANAFGHDSWMWP